VPDAVSIVATSAVGAAAAGAVAPASSGISIAAASAAGDAANSATGTVYDGPLTQLLGVDVLAAYVAYTFSTLVAAVSHQCREGVSCVGCKCIHTQQLHEVLITKVFLRLYFYWKMVLSEPKNTFWH